MSAISYHPHIDGLRAIAVLSVIIFHLNPGWLPGGFVGVDIFFVISGFLITSIILKEGMQGQFTYKQFYLRRMKRILPALFFVTICTLIAGYFLMLPEDFAFLEKSAHSILYFGSNFYFMNEGDYFSPAMIEMPLLHTWSLAVEEQFYFVWPFMLMVILYKAKKHITAITVALIIASFALSIALIFQEELSYTSYYLLPTRMGELLIGGLLAILKSQEGFIENSNKHKKLSNILSVVAFGLLVYSFVFINKDKSFPGYQALWPCIASVLLIFLGLQTNNNLFIQTLRHPVMVRIGLLSYSLYLWHWPVFTFIRYLTIDDALSPVWMVIALILTLVFSIISYQLFEKTFRKKSISFNKAACYYYLLPFFIIVAISFTIKTIGQEGTFQSAKDSSAEDFQAVCSNTKDGSCILGDKESEHKVLLIGDSHARHLRKLIDTIGKEQQWSATMLASPSCSSLQGMDLTSFDIRPKFKKTCKKLINKIAKSSADYDIVMISIRWGRYPLDEANSSKDESAYLYQVLENNIQIYGELDKEVVLVSLIPEYEDSVNRHGIFNLSEVNNLLDTHIIHNERLQKLSGKYEHVYFLDLASTTEQFNSGLWQSQSMYKDNNHLNYLGSLMLAQLILENNSVDWLGDLIRNQNKSDVIISQ